MRLYCTFFLSFNSLILKYFSFNIIRGLSEKIIATLKPSAILAVWANCEVSQCGQMEIMEDESRKATNRLIPIARYGTMMRRRGKQEVASGRYITIPISHVVLYFAVTNGHVVCMPFNWTSGIYGQIICLVIVLLKHHDVGTPLSRLQTPSCTHLWSLAAAFFSVMDLHW